MLHSCKWFVVLPDAAAELLVNTVPATDSLPTVNTAPPRVVRASLLTRLLSEMVSIVLGAA
jgi:hypothetical protein